MRTGTQIFFLLTTIALVIVAICYPQWAVVILIAMIVLMVKYQIVIPWLPCRNINPFLWLAVACLLLGALPIVAIKIAIAPPSIWLALAVAGLSFFAAAIFAVIGGLLEYEGRKAQYLEEDPDLPSF